MTVEKRIQTIFKHAENQPDIILIKNGTESFIDTNFFYVTQLSHGLFEGAVAILHKTGALDLLVSELEGELASKIKATLHIYSTKNEYEKNLKALTKPYKTIGINAAALTHKHYTQLKQSMGQRSFIDVSHSFTQARAIKDTQEIQKIRQACKISDAVMSQIPNLIYDGLTESELAAEINYLLQKNGSNKPAFDTISSFGTHTAQPHYTHSNTTVQPGDFILCDFGASYHRYNADITRTFIYGEATDEQRQMYQTVQEAQQRAFNAIQPGVRASEVHKQVYDYINETAYHGRFIHSTGHAVGLNVHDGPSFTIDNNEPLKENMVLTVEPGIYIPGTGGVRIEDDILVKKDGIELLTSAARTLHEIPN